MNKEQLEIYKRAAQKSNHVVRVDAENLLAIIALAERTTSPVSQMTELVEEVSDAILGVLATFDEDNDSGQTVILRDLRDRVDAVGEKLAAAAPQEQAPAAPVAEPSFDQAEFDAMVEKGTKAWAGVPAPRQEPQDKRRIGSVAGNAAADVLAERRRQVEAEGWTPEHDDEHSDGSMARAAACYALHTEPVGNVGDYLRFWPWASQWWKPKDRRRNLVKAGALILAEIERIDRTALAKKGGAA